MLLLLLAGCTNTITRYEFCPVALDTVSVAPLVVDTTLLASECVPWAGAIE